MPDYNFYHPENRNKSAGMSCALISLTLSCTASASSSSLHFPRLQFSILTSSSLYFTYDSSILQASSYQFQAYNLFNTLYLPQLYNIFLTSTSSMKPLLQQFTIPVVHNTWKHQKHSNQLRMIPLLFLKTFTTIHLSPKQHKQKPGPYVMLLKPHFPSFN